MDPYQNVTINGLKLPDYPEVFKQIHGETASVLKLNKTLRQIK